MAVSNTMFIFEVVVENVNSLVESRCFVIRSDFADIFSLELKDPKQMHIVMPEPLPLPPAPPGKGKKGKAKPKPNKGKKGKKGQVEEPPKEPLIQSGQSILFSSNAEFLIQNMKKFPLEVSLWSKEEHLILIGSSTIPWDPIFVTYLERILNNNPAESVTLKDEYNIFQEGTAKILAKLGIQIKLSYLGDKVTTSFRTLSEDPFVRKCLYTGVNNKSTSYMCTMKTTEEDFEANSNKIDNKFIIDNPRKVVYADYKNAPGANLTFFNDGDYCCMGTADKPPESKYKAPQTCPDIDFIVDYVRKIIVSCNDNMRMLTPRPTITPRIKATDIDRLCYCKETDWPDGEFADRFKKEAQSGPCPLCLDSVKAVGTVDPVTFDIANIRGPCGKPDCRIARDIRAYIQKLVVEDNKVFDLSELIGPCGSKSCTLAEKIQEFLRHEGDFAKGQTLEGLSTQCACIETMKTALARRSSCDSVCSYECEQSSDSEKGTCEGEACPHKTQKVYSVFYFTVEYNFDKSSPGGTPGASSPKDDKSVKLNKSTKSSSNDEKCTRFKYCTSSCPSLKASAETCSKSLCSGHTNLEYADTSKCTMPECQTKREFPPSPADSNIVIDFKNIHNLCTMKSCEVAVKVKDFISDVAVCKKKNKDPDEDPCYCDCVCDFKFTKHTTYCPVCGGYECLGDDLKNEPDYIKPLPCPIYHKTYDKKYISTRKLPADEDENDKKADAGGSGKSSKTGRSMSKTTDKEGLDKRLPLPPTHPQKAPTTTKADGDQPEVIEKDTKDKQDFTALDNVNKKKSKKKSKKPKKIAKKPQFGSMYPYPSVPKSMGWNWTAEDIPGLSPRPDWKPGAANKNLVRKYRAVREGMDVIAKKKRALMQRKKKPDSKPTLTITKQDGEYTVQMEVFKKYSKERLLFQNPYDDKPPVIYTIGKTEEEKRTQQRQRDRRERREIRRKSRLLQSTFRDKCQEICLKAYNQAIGVLPLPNANFPDCPCATASGQELPPPVDSCSCSECGTISTSDTDNDEWVIEFSPPAARYDAKAKHPVPIIDSETQYTYLDYKVKLLDKSGNQVPRMFTGPDDKQQCSDLGGFWDPNHVWLEINKDGFIGPDNRWAPMNFIGPDGMFYSAEEGSFTDNSGHLLKIGVDGYINKENKWTWYKKDTKVSNSPAVTSTATRTKVEIKGSNTKADSKSKEPTNAKSPVCVRTDKAKPVNVKSNCVCNTKGKGKNTTVMRATMKYENNNKNTRTPAGEQLKEEEMKLEKYKEIMQRLQVYEDFFDERPLVMTNRATQNSVFHPRTAAPAEPISMAVIRSMTKSYRSSTTFRS